MQVRVPRGAIPQFAQFRVGTKLLLLVLLPVCVLVGFTVMAAATDMRDANHRRAFQTAAQRSFATAGVVEALEGERDATALQRLRQTGRTEVAAAQRNVDNALRREAQRAAGARGLDVPGRLAAADGQLRATRRELGSLSFQQGADAYDVIIQRLLGTVRELDEGAPTQASERAANAYLAALRATDAAEHESLNVASVLAGPGHDHAATAARRLNRGPSIQRLRDRPLAALPGGIQQTTLKQWLVASGGRIANLRRVEHGAERNLAATAASDVSAARSGGVRDVALSVAVLVIVAGLAFALRRSITGPLREVSKAARTLSSGDLSVDVHYAGRDEIGDVAAAFRELHVTTERLAGEIRVINTAISENRLRHRADVGAFDGTWARLLAGMNDSMQAFSELHGGRRRAEGELERIFNLSLDALCIAGFDGYYKRVNPAFEQTLGYTSHELLSRPLLEFVHPDDRTRAHQALYDYLSHGRELSHFEGRYVRSDGTSRWLQWSARPVPEEGLIYAAARDVTASRQAGEEQATLRRVATLVARGVPANDVFAAVADEMRRLLGAAAAELVRYEADGTATIVAGSGLGRELKVGTRLPLEDGHAAAVVAHTGRPARLASEDRTGAIAAMLRKLGIQTSAGMPIMVEGRLWGVMLAGWSEPQSVLADTERRMEKFTELIATAIANADSRAQLRASRARIADAADETRRRIERDLHDGLQQRLVSLGLQLRMAEAILPAESAEARAQLSRVAQGMVEALDELREVARGIHPAILSQGGLSYALASLARRSPVPVEVTLPDGDLELPDRIERAAYYVVSEAITNAAKYSQASVVQVDIKAEDLIIELAIHDDGVGGADPARGSGMVGLTDRVEALGGKIRITSPPGHGTSLLATLPIEQH